MRNLTLILSFIIMTSCAKSQFEGEWNGIYSGKADKGNWNANIDDNGIISGQAESSISNFTYEITGKVNDDGVFTATYVNSSHHGDYYGQFKKDSVSGTWANPKMNLSGILSGKKQ